MALQGLQDIFRAHREKATGLWKLGQEPHRTIYFDAGDIVFAQSTHPQDRLTSMLVERNKLTQAQLDYALGNLKPGKSIGKNLIEMGFITQRDLLDVARAQVERIVAGAMGQTDETPFFEAKSELDITIVRLPFFTPELLLQAILGQQNREGLLELLGPLNQVVVMQGRKLHEIELPADLSKLSSLVDGTRTLLELSRESLTEPLRLGIFALFLREMGWARLHEMPPMDKGALDLALTAEPEPLSQPLSQPLPELAVPQAPSLFSSIHAAAMPTTNLDHLSQALDSIPEPGEKMPETSEAPEVVVEASDPADQLDADTNIIEGFEVATGRAILPTPSAAVAIPEEAPISKAVPEDEKTLEASLPESAPSGMKTEEQAGDALESEETLLVVPSLPSPEAVVLPSVIAPQEPLHDAEAPVEIKVAEPSEEGETSPRSARQFQERNPVLVAAAVLGVIGIAAYVGWRIMKQNMHKKPKPAILKPVGPKPAPSAAEHPTPASSQSSVKEEKGEVSSGNPQEKAADKLEERKPESERVQETKIEKAQSSPEKSEPQAGAGESSLDDRLKALENGDMALAVKQGEERRHRLSETQWTVRLEVACQAETLKKAIGLFEEKKPNLWVLPWKLKDGRDCYQLFLGDFPSKSAAEKQIPGLPKAFLAGNNKPRVIRVDELQERP